MENIAPWPSGSLSESLSNDSVMILFNNQTEMPVEPETSLPLELVTNGEADLTMPLASPTQSFFISGTGFNTSNLKPELENDVFTALNAFQLDVHGQLIPLYTEPEGSERENRLLLDSETDSTSVDSSLLLLKNSALKTLNGLNGGESLSLRNVLMNDIIITVPMLLPDSKLPDLLNLQVKPYPELPNWKKDKEVTTMESQASLADDVPLPSVSVVESAQDSAPAHYVEERLKIFQSILVQNEKKKPRTKPPRTESSNGELQYTCELCGMQFEKSHQYYGHLHVHSGEQPWDCEKCQSSFLTQYQLRRHERTYHQDLRPHVCPICSETFARHSQLDYHRRRVHEKEKSFKCEICSKAFFKASDLKTHLNIHLKVNGCVCETCGRSFSHVSNLIRHRRVHSGVKPYLCRACGRRFSQVTTLNEHKGHCQALTEPTQLLQCSQCSELLAPRMLRKHMVQAHGIYEKRNKSASVADKRKYYCKVCGDRFPFMNALKKHEHDVHSYEKSLACSKCKKEFLSMDPLLIHCCARKNKPVSLKPTKKKKKEENPKTEPPNGVASSSASPITINKDSSIIMKTKNSLSSKNAQENCEVVTYLEVPLLNGLNTSTPGCSSVENSTDILRCHETTKSVLNSAHVQLCDSSSNLDLSNSMLHANMNTSEILKGTQALSILKLQKEKENEDLIELSAVPDLLPNHRSETVLSEKLLNSNCVTVDLDFSKDLIMNGLLNSDMQSYGNVGSDKLPPLIPLCERFEKELFDSTDAETSENMMKLVGGDSSLDYKALLNDARTLILDSSEEKLAETISQLSGENLSSSLLRSVLLGDNGIENVEFSDTNYMPSHTFSGSQERNHGLHLNEHIVNVDPFKERKSISTEKNVQLNEYLILPSKRSSNVEPAYVCTHCDKAFFKLEELREHAKMLNISLESVQRIVKVSKDHPQTKSRQDVYKCPLCAKTFTKMKNLNQHVGVHGNDKCKYSCNVCDQKFAWKTSLSRHLASHVSEPLKLPCEMCDKTYLTQARLHEHVKRDHFHQRPHMCKICTKCFFKKSDLKAHMRTHTQEKPYMCGTCAKSFRHVSHLIRHERTHTGFKPYKCNHCCSSFTQLGVLRNHVKSKHPSAPDDKTS